MPPATEPMPEVFRIPVGWLLLPLPLIAAVSIASASRATKSTRISYSMSGVDCRFIRWLNLLNAPTFLGVIVTVPIVPVLSVTLSL